MKITLFLGTAATIVLMNTFVPAHSIDRSRDLDVDTQPSSSLINILDIPVMLPIVEEEQNIIFREHLPLLLAGVVKRRPTRVSIKGVWNTTEGQLIFNQGNMEMDASGGASAYLRPSATGLQILGEYNKRGGGIRGEFVNNTDVKGYWTQDYSNVKCSKELHSSSLTHLWPLSKKPTWYWGTFQFSFKRDGSFTGVYGYCDEEPQRSWSGTKNNVPEVN
jgi:hypothetical protein